MKNRVDSVAKIDSNDVSISAWIMLNYVAYFEIISKELSGLKNTTKYV